VLEELPAVRISLLLQPVSAKDLIEEEDLVVSSRSEAFGELLDDLMMNRIES